MKIIIISDIHGSLYYMERMKEIIKMEKPNKIILLGDLYYHGPRNPLPSEYNPMAVSKILNEYKNKIIAVQGNCDAEVDQMISDFKIRKNYKMTYLNKHFIFTHGHKYNVENIPNDCDYLVYGHFHTHFIKKVNNTICINVGSISIPKNNTRHSYMLINEEKIFIKDIDHAIIDEIQI